VHESDPAATLSLVQIRSRTKMVTFSRSNWYRMRQKSRARLGPPVGRLVQDSTLAYGPARRPDRVLFHAPGQPASVTLLEGVMLLNDSKRSIFCSRPFFGTRKCRRRTQGFPSLSDRVEAKRWLI